jgi:hypothetical protein
MDYHLPCECGRTLTVSERSAGVSLECTCGRSVKVPNLGELRTLTPTLDEDERKAAAGMTPGQVAVAVVGLMVFGGVLLLGALWAFALGGLAGLGYLTAQCGQVWLLVLIAREGHPDALLYALLIPFFTWYFAFRRWDIALWPFLCQVAGLFLLLLGLGA